MKRIIIGTKPTGFVFISFSYKAIGYVRREWAVSFGILPISFTFIRF